MVSVKDKNFSTTVYSEYVEIEYLKNCKHGLFSR